MPKTIIQTILFVFQESEHICRNNDLILNMETETGHFKKTEKVGLGTIYQFSPSSYALRPLQFATRALSDATLHNLPFSLTISRFK